MSELDREKLVTDNLKLVHEVANKYARRMKDPAIDYDDLYSEGCIGLIKAAQTFDPSKGFKFSGYAYQTIAGYILRFSRRGGYSVPHHIVDVATFIVKKGMSECTPEEIAALASSSCGVHGQCG